MINNPPTTNYRSEGLFAFYDKINDLTGSHLPLSNAEKGNVMIFQYAKDNDYIIDLSNHSRGGMTATNALQYAINHNLNEIPIREARFYGTATYVPSFADLLVKNDYTWWEGDINYGSAAYSAVHYTDFVGRTPAAGLRSHYIIGGNMPTGGVEDRWFLYSHSSYFREKPEEILKDSKGRNIDANGNLTGNIRNDNPYYEDFREKWIEGKHHNLNTENPSIPVLVRPSKPKEGVHYHETPH